MIKGGCLCGNVRFAVSGDIRPVVYCHCAQCRKLSGHFVAASAATNSDLAITGGIVWYSSSPEAERGFCPTCGSQLFWRSHGEENTSIHAGAFDEGTGLISDKHIFVDNKADYYVIDDGLPQYFESGEQVE